ncbi:MAG TPA: hypothetical protein PK409_01780 [Thermosynergistes sp.]|nr:hypothetical protein [Thermosynergistes sp.]
MTAVVQGEESKERHLEDLLAYVVGIPVDEIEKLMTSYRESGAEESPAALLRFLARSGRKYTLLWVVISYTNEVSIIAVALFGPDKVLIWEGVSAVPYGADSGSFRLWNRVLELASGIALGKPSPVSESDFWTAQQIARHVRAVWPESAPQLLIEAEEALSSEVPEGEEKYLELKAIALKKAVELEKELRDRAGRSLPLSALRMFKVSVPELREMALGVHSLQHALDDYIARAIQDPRRDKGIPSEENPEEEGGAQEEELLYFRPLVDPIKGRPLSDLRAGETILLDGGEEALEGQIYLIRLLRDGHYELHGMLAGGGYFKCVAPGDIKVKVPGLDEERLQKRMPLIVMIMLAVAIGILLFLL